MRPRFLLACFLSLVFLVTSVGCRPRPLGADVERVEIVNVYRGGQQGDSLRVVFRWAAAPVTSPRQAAVAGYNTAWIEIDLADTSIVRILAVGSTFVPQVLDTLWTAIPTIGDTLWSVVRVQTVDVRGDSSGWEYSSARGLGLPPIGPNPPGPPGVVDTVFVAVIDSLTIQPDSQRVTMLASTAVQWSYFSLSALVLCRRHELLADSSLGLLDVGTSPCTEDVMQVDSVVFPTGERESIEKALAGTEVRIERRVDPPTSDGLPARIDDLRIVLIGAGRLEVQWTGVNDGTGLPAKYDVRVAPSPLLLNGGWGQATDSRPTPGSAVGASFRYSVGQLEPGRTYDIQVIAHRGTMNQDAIYGQLSNVVSGTPE